MPVILKIELLVAVLFFLYIIYKTIKSKKLTVRYSILWLGVVVGMLILAIFAGPLESFSSLLGIKTTSNMVFLFFIGLLLFLTFSLTVFISQLKQKMITLTQEFGILKNELDERNEENERKN